MPSLLSHVLVAALRLQRRRRPFTDLRALRAKIAEERRSADPTPPRSLPSRCAIAERQVAGARVYTLSPRGGARSAHHVIYLHGGCYLFEIDPYHWRFCAALVRTLGCEVTVPIYPLAPEHGVDDALRVATATYRDVATRFEGRRMTLMGDSAGGGMALALAQRLDAEGLPQPKDLVLLAPWVDVAMDNPAIADVEARDPWLARPGLVEAGRMYAKGADARDPRVSPLHGELTKLGALSIFIGTRDLLLPDARLLAARAREAGTATTLFEYEHMVHDFMLVDLLPEAKRAFADIASVLR
ncbi:MAG: alpha/beta hydrolase [Labilithrix sp.]|nr:alpha/beta hydrolase [Labilithrix sp.]